MAGRVGEQGRAKTRDQGRAFPSWWHPSARLQGGVNTFNVLNLLLSVRGRGGGLNMMGGGGGIGEISPPPSV